MRREVALMAGMLVWAVAATGAEPVQGAHAAEARAEARQRMLGTLPTTQAGVHEEQPTADGDYVYEATSARPVVEGERCEIEADKVVPGLTLVRGRESWLALLPDGVSNPGVYWRLGNIVPGRYWIGVVFESQIQGVEAAEIMQPGVGIFLNGRIVQCAGHSDPVQVAPGIWFVESQALTDEALQPGDEIAAATYRGGRMARLVLRSRAPVPGPHRMALNVGGQQWNPYTAMGVNVDAHFVDSRGQRSPSADPHNAVEQRAGSIASMVGTAGVARVVFTLANPLPIALTVAFEGTVTSYYREELVRLVESVTLAPHTVVRREATFPWRADEPAQTAEAIVRAVQGKRDSVFSVRYSVGSKIGDPTEYCQLNTENSPLATLRWPAQEVLSYFPGQRHVLPWPDPYRFRVVRRVTLEKAADGFRDRLVLDAPGHSGVWQHAYTPLLQPPMPPPADLVFKPISVPNAWHVTASAAMEPQPHGVYMRRTFAMPDALGDRSYRLVIDGATDEATAYVNGIQVGNIRGAETPLECDITRALRPGSNELTVVVRDLLAIMNPAYVDTNAPTMSVNYLDAPGLFSTTGMALDSVSIEVAPAVSAEDVFVMPSVRKQALGARITAANRGNTPARVRVRAEVLDHGKAVLSLGVREVELAAQATAALTLETPWSKPRLWEATDPHLYVLAVEITDAATGRRLDWRRERFGFRESWVDGPNVMFNGHPIRPVGHGAITRLRVGGNQLLTRGGGARVDYNDEVGELSGQSTVALYNQPSQHNVERDEFWRATEANTLISLRRLQNHPSIVVWELSNEWLWYLQYSVTDIMAGARRFKHHADVVRAYDPTRWTRASAEGDAFGLLDNMDFHYMSPYFEPSGFGMRGVSEYLPDSQFWRPLARPLKRGEAIPLCPYNETILLKPDKKVILDTEFIWKSGGHMMPPGPTQVLGEDDVLSPAVDLGGGPIAWQYKTMIDGHRDLGVVFTHVHNSGLAGVTRGGYLPQTAILPENQHHGFAGRRETRRFTLVNSLFQPAEFVLTWTLTGPDGRVADKGRVTRRMDAGGLVRGELAFKLPRVRERTRYPLAVRLQADGQTVCGEEWDLDVWPDAPVLAGQLARKVVLFEPEGDASGAALTAAAVPFQRLRDLAGLTGPTSPTRPTDSTLVIAENALTEANAASTAVLADWVEAGGRVLVLRQEVSPLNLPAKTVLEPRQWASQVFVRMGDHPIFSGSLPSPTTDHRLPITDYDLHFWQPDRAVGLGAYSKPPSGAAVTLADSGGHKGMEWAHLLELYRGKGLYLLCQLPLVSRYDQEPMARELLARLVRYGAGAAAYCQPTNTLTVMAAPDSAVLKRLEDVGAKTSVQCSVFGVQTGNVLVDAAFLRGAAPSNRQDVAHALRAGATVVVAGATPEDTHWLSELAGVPVTLAVTPYRMWEGRGYRRGWSPLTAGLSHLDFYWKPFLGDERAGSQQHDPTHVIEPLQDYAIHAVGGAERVFPGALVEVAVGQGRLVLDQRRWWTAHPDLIIQTSRNLAALLTGLNVALAPTPPPPELPKGVAYRPIDLSPYANRGLIDEVAEDGKGGWSDQGPRCDLRTFPTGPQLFKGVPFGVGKEPKVCIVLASKHRPGFANMPQAVDIPVGYPVEGLFFLHSAAYSGKDIATYTMEYADGQSADIKLVGGENISDWNGVSTLLRENGTQSVAAWIGKNDTFPIVSVYRMLWVNPRPDVPVKQVHYANPRMGCVSILVGMTAAVKPGGLGRAAGPAGTAELLSQARAADTANQLEEALRLYRQAVSADPTLEDAYPAMLAVAERMKDDDHVLEAAWMWGLSGFPAYLAWNRFGEILEKRGDARGALEAYRKSLEIEWNQPPTLNAVRRLEK